MYKYSAGAPVKYLEVTGPLCLYTVSEVIQDVKSIPQGTAKKNNKGKVHIFRLLDHSHLTTITTFIIFLFTCDLSLL